MAAQAPPPTPPTPTPTPNPNFAQINPGPCDFSDQFYNDNGLDSSKFSELSLAADGRFGTFRQFGPPATGSFQPNWTADSTCSTNDPTRRNFRILAATAGNADDANSPFTCSDQSIFAGNGGPGCVNQPTILESLEFISLIAFIHNENAFIGANGAATKNYTRTVGFINGGLEGVQQNPGINITIQQGSDPQLNPEDTTVAGEPPVTAGLTLRGESMQFIVSNFEAYGAIDQFHNTLQCPQNPPTADPTKCTPVANTFAGAPCSVAMINNLQASANHVSVLPQFCFRVADAKVNGKIQSDVSTPFLRQDWRFATNRNAMDGSDNNGVTNGFTNNPQDSPYGYFCDDLLGMWIITYFWFTQPPHDPTCGVNYNAIGSGNEPLDPSNPSGGFVQVQGNGFSPDGFPIIMTANELNNWLEGTLAADGVTPCGAEGQEDPGGTDGGAAWLVCPAIPDPRNGGITADAFLDVTNHTNGAIDTFVQNNFTCLQTTGKFCFESAPGQ